MTSELRAALLVGLGGGLRSFAPPVALGLRGRGPLAGAARFIALGAAAGELVADKQPEMGSRLARRGMTMRMGFSGSAGYTAAGWPGAAVAAAAALGAANAGSRLRLTFGGTAVAFAEDVASYALVLAGARSITS